MRQASDSHGVIHDVAVLLRRFDYSETSLVTTWFTEHYGKIRLIAKGARRRNSAFLGQIDPFQTCEIRWVPSRNSELHTLTESSAIRTFQPLRADYDRLLAGTYCAELIELSCALEDPSSVAFHLLLQAWEYLETHQATLRLLQRFEKALAVAHGFAGSDDPQERASRALLQHLERTPASRDAAFSICRKAPP